jgi:hypothetical protein
MAKHPLTSCRPKETWFFGKNRISASRDLPSTPARVLMGSRLWGWVFSALLVGCSWNPRPGSIGDVYIRGRIHFLVLLVGALGLLVVLRYQSYKNARLRKIEKSRQPERAQSPQPAPNTEEEARERQRREELRRKPDDHEAEAGRLVRELLQLTGTDGGFGNRERIRAIGEKLDTLGGMEFMQRAHNTVRDAGRRLSQDIWNGIGSWRS